jgi:tRNA (cytidine/uridine-2'-O-)-methyltransferase
MADCVMFTVTLLEPQIPPNTGNIARLCAATGTPLHIVGRIGFELNDRYLKRAGLDYWPYVDWTYFEDLDAYMDQQDPLKFHLFTTKSNRYYTQQRFLPGNVLVFGSETNGIPEHLLKMYANRCCTIPILNPSVRSLNLSSAAAIGLYEAIRQNTG